MARRRLQKEGNLYQQNGYWKLRWREDVIRKDGSLAREWSKPVWIGPSAGKVKLTEKQARRFAWDNFLSKLDQNSVTPKSIITVAEFVEQHFTPEHVEMKKKASRLFYESILSKHILPALGGFRLRDVTGAHVQKLIAATMAGFYVVQRKPKKGQEKPAPELRKYSPRMVQAIVNTVSAIWTKAERLEMFNGRNPARLATLPEITPVRKKVALTAASFDQLLKALPEPSYGIALTAALTGMNIAEICGMRWGYLNLTDEWSAVDGEALPPKTIAVRFQWAHGEYGTLKRRKRIRNIPLAASLAKYLVELRCESKFHTADDPVFTSRTGKPVDAHNEFNRRLAPIGERLGLGKVGWHQLRRMHTTLADQHAMSQSDRMAMMGHSSAAMTMHYTDEDLTRRRAVLEKISSALVRPAAVGVTESGSAEVADVE